MPVDRAVRLDNWICRPGWIEPRPGYIPQATGLGKPVQTVMAYNGYGSVRKLFAVAGSTIFDCSNAGAAVPTSVTTLRSPRMQFKMISNPSGKQYLVAVNGRGAPHLYDGSVWTEAAITPDTSATGSGNPFDPTTFVDVAVHKGRLWFAQAGSTDPVYLNVVGGVQGPANVFPLGQYMTKGGYLQAIGTWTVDSRQTVDEYIAFISSRGQVIIYQGTDPSTVDTWELVGIYNLGAPIGRRCCLRIAGDLIIVCIDGLVPMSEMLSVDRAATQSVALTATIMNAMAQAARSYSGNFGWQFIEYPKSTLAILNIPTQENLSQIQYVRNVITGAWSSFSGINANCWEVDSYDRVFFGGNDGTVYQWDKGAGDNGQPISCVSKGAFNSFGNAAQLKRYTMVQPLITTTGNPIPAIGINVDFQDDYNLSIDQPTPTGDALWDEVKWDQFKWPVQQTTSNSWISVDGIGHYVSIVTQVTTSPSISDPSASVVFQLNGWNILAESGGFI